MKRYNNDPAKARARELQRQTLEHTVLRLKKPQDVKVLCFPGYDGMEVLEVTDPLGIPRHNVTGVERDPEIARHIRKAVPGIDLQDTSLEDYLASRKHLYFDYVSLDFTQNLSTSTVSAAVNTGLSMRANNYLMHVAVQKQREHADSQKYMQELSYAASMGRFLSSRSEEESYDFSSGSIEEMRESSLLTATLGPASAQRASGQASFFRYVLGDSFDATYKMVVDNFLEAYDAESQRKVRDLLSNPGGIEAHNLLTRFDQALMAVAKDRIYRRILEQFSQATGNLYTAADLKRVAQQGAPMVFAGMLNSFKGHSFVINHGAKYAYVSESGTPMIGNLAFMHNDRKAHKHFDELLSTINTRTIDVLDTVGFIRKVQQIPQYFSSRGGVSIASYIAMPRAYLGSSARPIIRKAKAIELLREGRSAQELSREYRGMSLRTLGALQAHVTMGTYSRYADNHDEQSRSDLMHDIEARISLLEEGVHVNGGEVLARGDILEYLSAGVPPREIHEAYPGTSLPRIHALDHWRKKREGV